MMKNSQSELYLPVRIEQSHVQYLSFFIIFESIQITEALSKGIMCQTHGPNVVYRQVMTIPYDRCNLFIADV